MTTTAGSSTAAELQQLARDHLWLHFTRMGGHVDPEVPVIVRGDGCYLEDSNGKRYLDALAGLFSVNLGYGFGEEMSINGIPALRNPFEPLVPEVRHVRNTNRYHRPPEETEAEFTGMLLEELEETILAMGPETVCLVHMEPVQNAGGAFTPPEGYWRGVSELCDRYESAAPTTAATP